MKPTWDKIWMDLAVEISKRSNDPKIKVGAVIVTADNESVLSIGYNGDEKGGRNARESMESGKSAFIHAEVNAVTKMNYVDPRERKIYLTHSPCAVCSKLLINARITEVIYRELYKFDTKGIDILMRSDIMVRQDHDYAYASKKVERMGNEKV